MPDVSSVSIVPVDDVVSFAVVAALATEVDGIAAGGVPTFGVAGRRCGVCLRFGCAAGFDGAGGFGGASNAAVTTSAAGVVCDGRRMNSVTRPTTSRCSRIENPSTKSQRRDLRMSGRKGGVVMALV